VKQMDGLAGVNRTGARCVSTEMSRGARSLVVTGAAIRLLGGCHQPAQPIAIEPAPERVIADARPALEIVPTQTPEQALVQATDLRSPTHVITAVATPRQQPATGMATDGWHWDSPAPQGNDLAGIWGNGDTLYAVGSAGTVLHSSDRGHSWQLTYVDHDLDLIAVWGSSPTDIYIGGKRGAASLEGVLLHSTDRGVTWQRRDTTEQIAGIWGRSADDVYVVGSAGLIEHSIDRGASWQPQSSTTTDNLIAIAGDGTALVVVGQGLRGELLRRGRDDARWKAAKRPVDENWQAVCVDRRGGVVAAGLTGIARSTDRGQSWTVQHPSKHSLFGVWCGVPGEAVAVGEHGTILRTHDGGRNWLPATTDAPIGTDLAEIWGATDGRLIAVGKSGTILRSLDRGRSWQSLRSSAPYLLAIWGSSPQDLYAVGWNGALLHGTGDEHWTTLSLGTDAQLVSVWGSGPDDVYVVSWFGEIFHSTDRGRTWAHDKVDGTLAQVWGTNRDDVYLIGASGRMMHSADRGKSWQQVTTGTDDHLDAIWGDGAGEIDVVGSSGVILQSRDRGKHWQRHQLWPPKDGVTGRELLSVIGNAAGERFAVGYCDGCLVYSRDRGVTWEIRATNATGALRGLYLDGDQVVALGDDGALLRLNEPRTAWDVMATPTGTGLTATFGNPRERYAVGYAGTILHRRRH